MQLSFRPRNRDCVVWRFPFLDLWVRFREFLVAHFDGRVGSCPLGRGAITWVAPQGTFCVGWVRGGRTPPRQSRPLLSPPVARYAMSPSGGHFAWAMFLGELRRRPCNFVRYVAYKYSGPVVFGPQPPASVFGLESGWTCELELEASGRPAAATLGRSH